VASSIKVQFVIVKVEVIKYRFLISVGEKFFDIVAFLNAIFEEKIYSPLPFLQKQSIFCILALI